ncbi:MAG: hypothetical protein IIZ45_00635 [Firmicutes bacterium]|nr:hypothetical protein [Bacillota bacterium]
MKAIVYTSETGFTARYAKMLGDAIDLPVYSLAQARSRVSKNDPIIYMGWVKAGHVQGYKAAAALYDIKALCAVGMARPDEKSADELAEKYSLTDTPVFPLQGGFYMDKLHGMNKMMMKTMANTVGKAIARKKERTADEEDMLELLTNGGDRVNADGLKPILDWWEQRGE